MNIDQARGLSLEAFIKRLGHQEVQKGNDREAWFLSPLRDEKTASFKVDRAKNKFIDFGDGAKGDIVDFVRAYGPRRGWGNLDVSEALSHIASRVGELPKQAPANKRGFAPQPSGPAIPEASKSSETFRIDYIGPLQSKKLIDYLRERKLHVNTAKDYLQQIHYTHLPTRRQYYGLTWANEQGGQEVRNPYFKAVIGTKAPSVIEVNHPKRVAGTAVFEGMTDYLSYLQLAKQEVLARAVVMNSTSMHQRVIELLSKLPKNEPIKAYLQNDAPGLKVAAILKEGLPRMEIQNHKYAAYADINDFLMGKPLTMADKKHAQQVLEGPLKNGVQSMRVERGPSIK